MAAKQTKYKWNMKAFRQLRTNPRVKADLLRRGRAIAAAAGEGYDAQEANTRTRARVTVAPTTPEATRDNSTNNTLVRNLDAGR